MTKISRSGFFNRSKQVGPLEEEEVAVSGEYTDLEGRGGGGGESAPESDGLHCDILLAICGPVALGVGFWYTMLGDYYLPPEAGTESGRGLSIAGEVFLAIGAADLAALVVCGCHRRVSS